MQNQGSTPRPQSPKNPPQRGGKSNTPPRNNRVPGESHGASHMPTYFSVSSKKAKPTKRKAPAKKPKAAKAFIKSYPPKRAQGAPANPQQRGPAQGRNKKRRNRNPLISFFVLLVVALVIGFGVYYLVASSAVKPYENIVYPNVYVNGINVGGKSFQEAAGLVAENAQSFINQFSVKLTYKGLLYAEVNSGNLGITYNQQALEEQLQQALLIGHEGDVFTRKKILDEQLASPVYFSMGDLSKDTAYVDSLLYQLQQDVYKEAIDASVQFTADANEPFTFVQEQLGMSIDPIPVQEALLAHIEKMESGEIVLDWHITHVPPSVTLAQLQEQVTHRSSYQTVIEIKTSEKYKINSENRLHNIDLSMQAITLEIPNGKRFSFNDSVGMRTREKGYLDAIEYVYGEEEWGTGGGVCQSSTTIYMAAVQAGMDIKERHSHSMSVGYADPGRDATVYYIRGRELDLVFENNTGSSVYMVGSVLPGEGRNKICQVDIYGASMNGVAYDIRAVQEEIEAPADPIIKDDKEGRYVTYIDEEPYVSRTAKPGLKIYRTLYEFKDGVEVKTTDLGTDTYKPKQEIRYVGVQQRPLTEE